MEPEDDKEEDKWEVIFHPEFDAEFCQFHEDVQDELLAVAAVIKQFGPTAKRPRVDTLEGSKHANMKELRFEANDGVWRAAFAFDPKRKAIVLVAGDKSGMSQDLFYKRLIKKADDRFSAHLDGMGESKVVKKVKKGKCK